MYKLLLVIAVVPVTESELEIFAEPIVIVISIAPDALIELEVRELFPVTVGPLV